MVAIDWKQGPSHEQESAPPGFGRQPRRRTYAGSPA